MDPHVQKKVYELLKSQCDAPRILFMTETPLIVEKDGGTRRVHLISTRLFTYLVREKGFKLYSKWINRFLSVSAQLDKVIINGDLFKEGNNNGGAGGNRAAGTIMKQGGLSASETVASEWRDVTLQASSSLEANTIERKISLLARNADRTAKELALIENGGASNKPRDFMEDENDSESSDGDDKDNDVDIADNNNSNNGNGRRAMGMVRSTVNKSENLQTGLNMAPSRYIAITSLVDGEFADYSTLKTAYTRHEEENLLRDLEAFIKENEGQMETLCQVHYPAFIHAAQQCLTISEKDAQLVGEELSGATALVRDAVIDMKQVAANLIVSRSARNNLVQVRALVSRCMAVAEYVETAESQVERQQLIGALTSLKELVRLSAPLAEYAIGEYVLHVRVPDLSQRVFSLAVQHLNGWLKILRDSAAAMGNAALEWQGAIASGTVQKKIVMAEEGNYWWIVDSFQCAQFTSAPFAQGDLITKICNGAGIQIVFMELRRDEYFAKYYSEGRAQQAKADIFEAPFVIEGKPATEVATEFENFCATALGFMLIEDLVYSATSPHVQTTSEVLWTWDRLTQVLSTRALTISRALQSDPAYTEVMVRMFSSIRALTFHSVENIKCVQLNSVTLSRIAEALSDSLVSSWLQEACVTCTQLVLTDPLTPLVVNSSEEFEAYVTRFHLNKCSLLELPVPDKYDSGSLMLPYSTMVPTIGDKAMQLLTQCYSVIDLDNGATVRQSEVNNVDEMLLKYLSVLFRTVSESLQGQLYAIDSRSILQFGVFISCCSAMPVIVSCVEQQFMRRWQGSYGEEKQVMGSPKQLASSAQQFSRGVQKGIEGMMNACVQEMEDRLHPATTFSFWKRQLDYRSGKKKNEATDSFDDCINYFIALIPRLGAILQSTVLRSVFSTAFAHIGQKMQSCIEDAIKGAYKDDERDFDLMRSALHEFETQCTSLIPLWQRKLENVLPNVSASQRFPIQVQSVVEDLTIWIKQREVQYNIDRANQPQILAGIEGATKAVTKGFQAVGKTTANVFGKRD